MIQNITVMELKKILDSRRSTRKFLPRKVEHDKLQRIVDMALQAPSSRNTRSTRLLVVEKPEQLEKIASMRDYGSAFVKDAPAAIIVAADVAAKTSEVELIELRIAKGMCGKSYVFLCGEVSAVEAAISKAKATVAETGMYLDSAVIAHPDPQICKSIL